MKSTENKSIMAHFRFFLTLIPFLFIIGFILYGTFAALGTFGLSYSIGFLILIIYATTGMIFFTAARIWMLRNRNNLYYRGLVQVIGMWFGSIMFIAIGISLPDHYSSLNSFNAVSALNIAVIAATDFWVIENTTKTTVDLFTNGEFN